MIVPQLEGPIQLRVALPTMQQTTQFLQNAADEGDGVDAPYMQKLQAQSQVKQMALCMRALMAPVLDTQLHDGIHCTAAELFEQAHR